MSLTAEFTPKVINCDTAFIEKTTEINDKKTTACSVFYMNITFWLILHLCSSLSRQKCINTSIICLPRSSALWWNTFISQPLYKRWAVLISLAYLCTLKEEKHAIICSNEMTWKHKEKGISFSGSFPIHQASKSDLSTPFPEPIQLQNWTQPYAQS